MKRIIAIVLSLAFALALVGCANNNNDTVQFHGKTISTSELSPETIEWLEMYNGLTEEEQLSISSIPNDLYKALGYSGTEDSEAVATD